MVGTEVVRALSRVVQRHKFGGIRVTFHGAYGLVCFEGLRQKSVNQHHQNIGNALFRPADGQKKAIA